MMKNFKDLPAHTQRFAKEYFVAGVFAFLSILSFPCHAWASEKQPSDEAVMESMTGKIHLEELIQSAKIRNPDMIAAKSEWLAARKRVWSETSLPDPMAGYDIMGSMVETRVGPEKNRFMFSQDVPFPLKLIEKGAVANQEAHAAYARYQAIEYAIVAQLTKLYYELYFVDASIQTIEEIKTLLKQMEAAAQARYSDLSGSQRDVAKAQAEVSLSLEKLYLLRQQRESVVAMMNAILDRDPMLSIGEAVLPAKPELKYSLVELVNLAVQNRQEIKEMEALVSKSKHAKRLAMLANIPDLNVAFEYTRVGSGTTNEASGMDGRDSWMFPLRINLPLWQNRIIPEIQAAKKILESNQAKLLKVKNQTFYEVKDAYYRYDAGMKISDLYETAVIPQAELALTADKSGYESGKNDFLNLLDSERVYLNAKLTQIQFYTEALKAYADLIRVTGVNFENQPQEVKGHDQVQ